MVIGRTMQIYRHNGTDTPGPVVLAFNSAQAARNFAAAIAEGSEMLDDEDHGE